MKLIFGLQLDDLSVPRPEQPEAGTHTCGPLKLLSLLESYLGLGGHPNNIDYLRVEQYRQALLSRQSTVGTQQSFFDKSFEADQFATAAELLSRRDELLLAGWDFSKKENTPNRLACLAELELLFQNEEMELELAAGFADRFKAVMGKLETRRLPFTEVLLNEPLELLPCHFQRLFEKMKAHASISQIQDPEHQNPTTDLEKFQTQLPGNTTQKLKTPLSNDGSLILFKAKRANEAASFIAQLLRLNPDFRPTCLVPEKNRTLDIALGREGLPSLGIQSASLARPALQILKLAPTFLWKPIDPFKILEFVSLALKPLPEELSTLIANQIAQTPGMHGEGWYAMTNRYFSELENNEPPKAVAEQRKQYRFWFERPRYRMDGTVPKQDVVELFAYIREWAFQLFEESAGKNNSLIVLGEQARRIVELLQALPETELTFLELERTVRTIYEPSPVVFQERQVGHLPYTTHTGAFTGQVDEVLWWNFVLNEPPHFFSRWYRQERSYLEALGIHLDTPEQENARTLWHRTRPVLLAKKRLVLVLPEMVAGETALPHPLLGDLEAVFENLDEITSIVGSPQSTVHSPHFIFPKMERVEPYQLGKPKPFLNVRNLDKLEREYETLTSLESLFYYPYQWVFRYQIQLRKSSILSVVKDNRLMGNLAHRVFENLLKQDISNFEKHSLERWVEEETSKLFAREGAVLLMYGREPERIAFVNKLKYATWSLLSHIRENGWKVQKTEKDLKGKFPCNSEENAENRTPIRGIADLVLERGDELAVVDLKWRGAARRTNMIRNGEDLQLVLYARLLSENSQWPHTSYFIIENGKLLARNNEAFRGITPLAPEADRQAVNEDILAQMEATWRWRMSQLAQGQIEVRCRQTMSDIEETYSDQGQGELMLEILEMKGEDARWDDYRTLINLVE